MAETRENAQIAFDLFVKTYEDKYPGTVQCLLKDQDALLSFYDFQQDIGRKYDQRIRSNHASLRFDIEPNVQRANFAGIKFWKFCL